MSFVRRIFIDAVNSVFNNTKLVTVSKTAIIEPKSNLVIHPTAEIKDFCIVRSYNNLVTIDEYSQLNPFCVIYGGAGVKIGKNVMIGPHTVIAAGSHEYRNLDIPMRHAGSFDLGPIVISDDVWIGANCTLTDGVHIGKGAIVGANSVVTKNVDDYSIVAGCPAKVISSRLKYTK